MPIPQVLGVTTVGATTDQGDNNFLNGAPVTTSALGGTAVSVAIYVRAPIDVAAQRKYQLGIYTDANGKPGTFVAKTAQGTLTANAWNTLKISAPLLANTTYWLMANANGLTPAVNRWVFADGPGIGAYSTSPVAFGTWPVTFASTPLTSGYSAYVTLLP